MRKKIGIIGCGSWAEVIKNSINKNTNFKLKYLVCRNNKRRKKFNDKNIHIFESIEDLLKEHRPDALYLAGDPRMNYSAIKIANNFKIECIVEKPLCLNLEDLKKIVFIHKQKNNKIYINLPNLNDERFLQLKQIIFQKKILKVNIIEGSRGPFRKNIDPIWDWGTHPLTTLFYLFDFKECNNFNIKKIIDNDKIFKVYKMSFNYKKISIKIITGNYLKAKQRKIKFHYKNNEYLMYDFNTKKILSSENFKSKISILNKKEYPLPLEKLLEIFNKKKLSSNQVKIFECGINSTKVLNKFFKTT